MDPLNVSVEECARILGFGLTTTKRLLRENKIPSFREGARRLVPVGGIHRYQRQKVAEATADAEAHTSREQALDWSIPSPPVAIAAIQGKRRRVRHG